MTSIQSASTDDILRDPGNISEEFVEFFATTFVQENDGPLSDFKTPKKIDDISHLKLKLEDFRKILQTINESKEYGPD